jgi:hypothetical protein
MSTKKLSSLNSRGQSIYGNPGKLFRKALDDRIRKPGSVAWELANIFGEDNVRNLALLADPLSKFKLAEYRVQAANRTRKLLCKRKTGRGYTRNSRSKATSSIPNAQTSYAWDYVFPGTVSNVVTPSSAALADQQVLYGYCKDTTRKTRAIWVNQGEFELFAPEVYSRPRSWTRRVSDSYVRFDAPYVPYNLAVSEGDVTTQMYGPSATLTQAQLDLHALEESNNADQMLSKYAFGMLTKALPTYRPVRWARTVFEFRDLAETLANSVQGVAASVSRKLGIGEASRQYLNEKFGWENTLRDLESLLEAPDKVAKRINFLLARENKPTTFRSVRRFVQPLNNPPAFAYAGLPNESSPLTSTSGTRKVELRVVVNCRVRMPSVQQPEFRREHLNYIRGNELSPADIYRLVPWTWLIDWFESVGDYIDCIEAINSDLSLINYGFATYRSVVKSTTTYQANVVQSWGRNINGVATNGTINQPIDHSSRYLCRYQKRKDLATVNGVKRTWDVTSLSAFQQSILGALLLAKK